MSKSITLNYKDFTYSTHPGRYTNYELHFIGPDMGCGGAEYLMSCAGIDRYGMVNYRNKNHAMIETHYNNIEEINSKMKEVFDNASERAPKLDEFSKM